VKSEGQLYSAKVTVLSNGRNILIAEHNDTYTPNDAFFAISFCNVIMTHRSARN
jgi:hypothetical protein